MLDTGIAASGDLAGRVVASAHLSGEWNFTDSYGHGTFMAGLIAGSGQGGGPAGVAPGVDPVDLEVAGADGATTLGQVPAAMHLVDAARDRLTLRVLNVSLGTCRRTSARTCRGSWPSGPTWPRRPAGRPPTGSAAPTTGWSWSSPPDPWRSTRPLRLVQVPANLISNAHKYSPARP